MTDVLNEVVSLTLSYRDGLVRHIPDVSAFLVVRRIPLRHPTKPLRPSSVFVTPKPSKECLKYLDIRLNEQALDPVQRGAITYD